MIGLLSLTTALLGVSSAAMAAGVAPRQLSCSTKFQHMPWGDLTASQKTAYLDAELCLMEAPSHVGAAGAQTLWDDLQYNHALQVNWVHGVGAFLPWHRYQVAVHGRLLREECGYTGPLPYWDETADSQLAALVDSEIFQSDTFGGNGSGQQSYIQDGPFANIELRMRATGQPTSTYRISRNIRGNNFANTATMSTLNTCFQTSSFVAAWECFEGQPHNGGHGGTGGLMVDVSLSPGDPVFYLHHGWLDAMWWRWQSLDLDERLTDMGGRNVPRNGNPGRQFTDYSGDPGNVTTLNHVLFVGGLYPNVTIGDVMDVEGDAICGEYFFPSSLNVSLTTVVDGIMTETFIDSR